MDTGRIGKNGLPHENNITRLQWLPKQFTQAAVESSKTINTAEIPLTAYKTIPVTVTLCRKEL